MNTDYVVRNQRPAGGGHTTYAVVDMAGELVHVTAPRAISNPDVIDRLIRARVALAQRARRRRP